MYAELITQVCLSTGLSPNAAARVVGDVLAFFDETVEQFVRRRHIQLQRRGHTNDQIFEQIAGELQIRRVASHPMSQRQLRRIVYG
jgi:hypothetical protein